jgi:hypothetical protein
MGNKSTLTAVNMKNYQPNKHLTTLPPIKKGPDLNLDLEPCLMAVIGPSGPLHSFARLQLIAPIPRIAGTKEGPPKAENLDLHSPWLVAYEPNPSIAQALL